MNETIVFILSGWIHLSDVLSHWRVKQSEAARRSTVEQ